MCGHYSGSPRAQHRCAHLARWSPTIALGPPPGCLEHRSSPRPEGGSPWGQLQEQLQPPRRPDSGQPASPTTTWLVPRSSLGVGGGGGDAVTGPPPSGASGAGHLAGPSGVDHAEGAGTGQRGQTCSTVQPRARPSLPAPQTRELVWLLPVPLGFCTCSERLLTDPLTQSHSRRDPQASTAHWLPWPKNGYQST